MQEIFKNISGKVTKEVFEKMEAMLKADNPYCNTNEAWSNAGKDVFDHCTKSIGQNDPVISKFMDSIEEIARLDQSIINSLMHDIWYIFEEMDIKQQLQESQDLSLTKKKIENTLENIIKNSQQTNCVDKRCGSEGRKFSIFLPNHD